MADSNPLSMNSRMHSRAFGKLTITRQRYASCAVAFSWSGVSLWSARTRWSGPAPLGDRAGSTFVKMVETVVEAAGVDAKRPP
jgi:hypothetical protein